jgi:citrate lyase subunit beta/citryl-CoA lyase
MSSTATSWRSVLFVPGNRPELASKALRCEPDAVVVDLEDAVPAGSKESARADMRTAVGELADRVAVCVRVNPPSTSWFEQDVASLPAGLAGVMVPKWEVPVDLGLPVVAGLETVLGVADARVLLGPPVVACYFGAEDYVADLGGVRSPSNSEVATARALVGIAARLAGVAALDMTTIDFGDTDRFTREAREARGLGYAGKLCIHPGQVPLANTAFTATAAEVDRARRLLAAFDESGGETIAFEGQMIDEVVAKQARALVVRSQR